MSHDAGVLQANATRAMVRYAQKQPSVFKQQQIDFSYAVLFNVTMP